jgi:hypothetical protein
MTREDKIAKLECYCGAHKCSECIFTKGVWEKPFYDYGCPEFSESPESDLDKALKLIGLTRTDDAVDTESCECESVETYTDSDPVNHPSHYTDGKIEVIDYIEDKKLGFCLGNAIKYISRAGKKDPDKTVQDLRKAIWYIERRIMEIEEGLGDD